MSDDYNNTPMGFAKFFEEWTEANKRPRPFWRRVGLWLGLGGWCMPWSETKWIYPSLHGISTERYPNWNELPPTEQEDET